VAAAQEQDPSISLQHQEDLVRLRTAFARLSPAERTLLTWRFTEGLGSGALAQRLGVNDECAKKRLTRALSHLRETFVP